MNKPKGFADLEKKVAYVVNRIEVGDASHLYHVLNLLQAMGRRGWTVSLLSERGGVGNRTVAGCNVTYLSKSGYFMRTVRLIRELTRLRAQGYRLVFVRISR